MPNTVNDAGTDTVFCAEAVPALDTTNIKGAIREFERWMAEVSADWPQSLKDAGQRALLSLKMMDGQELPAVMMAMNAADLQAFAKAYAEWRG